MLLAVRMLTEDGEEISASYVLRLGGWTEERYFHEASETRVVEFEDGEVIVHSPGSRQHQRLVRFLTMLLQAYVFRLRLGEILNGPAVVRLRPGLNYEPDLFFIPATQISRSSEEFFSGAPGLIVEVVSEGSRGHDLRTKAWAYREHGVPDYWVVDPERRILVQHLLPADPRLPYRTIEHAAGRVDSQAIPGFWMDVAWLWQDPLPDVLHCLEQIFPT